MPEDCPTRAATLATAKNAELALAQALIDFKRALDDRRKIYDDSVVEYNSYLVVRERYLQVYLKQYASEASNAVPSAALQAASFNLYTANNVVTSSKAATVTNKASLDSALTDYNNAQALALAAKEATRVALLAFGPCLMAEPGLADPTPNPIRAAVYEYVAPFYVPPTPIGPPNPTPEQGGAGLGIAFAAAPEG